MLTLIQRQGVGGSPVELYVNRRSADGGYEPAVGLFAGDEPIQCTLWAGDDRAQATTLPCDWLDAPNATVKVQFPATTTAALDVGWYQALVERTDLDQALIAFRVQVEPGPGSAARPPAYHTYADLTAELPWVGKLADHLQDQGGFAELAGEARQWIDDILARSVPSRAPRGLISSGAGWSCCDGSELRQAVIDALAADRLIVDRRIKQASVYYTLHRILRRSIGYKTANDLIAMSQDYKTEAEGLMASGTARITDAGGEDWCELPIGRIYLRRA